MRPPSRWNLAGSRKNSTISCRSSLASSTPATSSKVTRPCASVRSLARLLPKPSALPPAPCIWRDRKIHTPIKRDERQPGNQQRHEPRHVVAQRTRRDRHALVIEALHQRRVARRIALEGAAVGEVAVDFGALDQDVTDAALVDLVEQLREGNVLRGGVLARILKQREQCKQQQDNDDPQGEIAQIGVHLMSLTPDRAESGGLMRAGKSWRLHVPSTRQCKGQPAPCQGNPLRKPRNIYGYFVKRAVAMRAKSRFAARRRAFDRQPVAAEADQGAGQGPAQPGIGLAQRVIKALELGELDRALVAGMGDGAAEEPQRHFGGQSRKLVGRECDRTALRPRPRRQRLARRGDGEFDRHFGAPHAAGQARQPARIESLFGQRRHERAQPRAREARIAVARILAIGDAGGFKRRDQPRLGNVQQRADQKKSACRGRPATARHTPCRQGRRVRCRGRDETAPFRPDRRAYARSGYGRIRRAPAVCAKSR